MGEDAAGGDRQRLTVPEAATVLGVTVDAVRGRIRRGKLASEHDENGTVYVWVETPEVDRPGPSPTVEGPSHAQSELVEALQDQIQTLKQQLATAEERDRENRRLLAAALERIPAIEAPQEAAESTESAEPQSDRGTTPEEQEQRSWWRRMFGG